MGVLIMHEWGCLLALASGSYAIWAGIWAILYRKYFWDMIGGTLGPNGLIPGPNAAFFVAIIVKVPVLQVINIVHQTCTLEKICSLPEHTAQINGLLTLALEWPLPFIAGTPLHRSFVLRIVFYVWAGVIAMFPYQTVDAGVFYAITAIVYLRAISRGEIMKGARANTRVDIEMQVGM
ncbi:hypothetical protein RQP46_010108 [Phenoliferia psychrophenolica]